MNPQQSNDHRTSPNIFEDDDLLTFDNNHPSGSYLTPEITARFKEVTVEVAAAARPPVHETNLVCLTTTLAMYFEARPRTNNNHGNHSNHAPSVRHQLYTTQRPSRYRKIASMPVNKGFHSNQAPEIVPAMAPSSENPLVTTTPIMSAPVMPTLAAPIPVDPPQEPNKPKKPDDEDPFDDFEFDNEDLDEVKRFLTDQCSVLELYDNLWLDHESPTVYLSSVKCILVKKTEKEEESIIEKLKKNLDNEALTDD
ncbi:23126_t:CDS:2 [Cetraspora pellucida]|uniref:23126_t:CDS:1 n=1 Tax=Cetraspora pellucida TaxID=1433469 RepID=A0A9N9FJ89_9GLOM|nr:23126_t:CDS:2 [Cetraspora pellucida]